MRTKGKLSTQASSESKTSDDARRKSCLLFGVGGLVFVPIFKAITGLPPFMGVILALAVLWLVTDLMHFPIQRTGALARSPHLNTHRHLRHPIFSWVFCSASVRFKAAGYSSGCRRLARCDF